MLTAEKPVRKIHPLLIWAAVNIVLVLIFCVRKIIQQKIHHPDLPLGEIFTKTNAFLLTDYVLTAGIAWFGAVVNLTALSLFRSGRKLLLGILIFGVTAEVGLRIAEPFFPSDRIKDAKLGVRMRPRQAIWSSNDSGFNDLNYPKKKPLGVYRIIALGDSFNWAGGYEKNYWTLTERALNKDPQFEKIEILNQGTGGIGPKYLFRLLSSESVQYQPDAVVLAIFTGNDLDEPRLEKQFISVRFGYPAPIKARRLKFFDVTRDSYLAFFCVMKWELFRNEFLKRCEYEKGMRVGLFSRNRYLEIQQSWARINRPEFYTEDPDWLDLKKQLVEYKKYLDTRNIQFFAAVLPHELQVSQKLQEEVQNKYPETNLGDLALPQKKLGEILREMKIPYVDLLSVFQEKTAKGAELYLYSDTHFNDAGNALAAEQVTAFLKAQIAAGWRPQP